MNFSWLTDPLFWTSLTSKVASFGIFAPLFLAMLESLIPALPLVLIVILNVNIYGLGVGFLTSYLGTMLGATIMFMFYRTISIYGLHEKMHKIRSLDKTINWVHHQSPLIIIVLSMLPSTPSSFMNLAFGLAQYSKRKYLSSIALGKIIMIGMFALFGKAFQARENQMLITIISILLFAITYYIACIIHKKTGIHELNSK